MLLAKSRGSMPNLNSVELNLGEVLEIIKTNARI